MVKKNWEYILTEDGERLQGTPLREEVARILSQISKSGKVTLRTQEDRFIATFLLREGYIDRWSWD